MSPRAKRAPDSIIIEAAARVAAERGAPRTRLADVAAASGFAAATLVQRFGSRERLLQAVGEAHIARIRPAFATRSASFLEHLCLALQQLHLEGHFSFLLASSATAPAYSVELRNWIGQTLAAAVEAGELPPCDVAEQARRIQFAYYGRLLAAHFEAGSLAEADMRSLVTDSLADFM